MKLALIGYGKMGREVEQAAKNAGHQIVSIIDPIEDQTRKPITEDSLKQAEVCIDFSSPSAVLENIKLVAACKRNMVVGTTGWYDHLDEVKSLVQKENVGLIYAPNFSIGVNIFLKIVEHAGTFINKFADYDPYIIEHHHRQKADSPSGTALQLGKILLEKIKWKQTLLTNSPTGKIPAEAIHVSSVRAGSIFGTHIIGFDSPNDRIELKHEAHSRRGFAQGALLAAEWIRDKKGLFRFTDIF